MIETENEDENQSESDSDEDEGEGDSLTKEVLEMALNALRRDVFVSEFV